VESYTVQPVHGFSSHIGTSNSIAKSKTMDCLDGLPKNNEITLKQLILEVMKELWSEKAEPVSFELLSAHPRLMGVAEAEIEDALKALFTFGELYEPKAGFVGLV